METAFERHRKTVGWIAGPLLFVAILVLPIAPLAELPSEARRLAAVFALVVAFWIGEAIPLPATALLGVALTVPLGIASAKQAFAGFGHPVLFLFLGGFLISRAMVVHGLDRRIALFVLSRSWVGNDPGRILLAFGAIGAFLSMWMSNTATTAMMLPIALGVLRTLNDGAGGERDGPASALDRRHASATGDEPDAPETNHRDLAEGGAPDRDGRGYAIGLMLTVAFSCNIGGIATPVGSPPNLIALGLIESILGRRIGFFEWMRFGVPIAAVLFVFLYLVMRLAFARRQAPIEGAGEAIRRARAALPPWSAGERVTLAAFGLAVTLWTLPGIVGVVAGDSGASRLLERAFPESVSAILAASLLFLAPTGWTPRRFALSWHDAVRIDWGTILLFGGGLGLGALAFETGLAEALGTAVVQATGGMALVWVVLVAVLIADLMTELMSNTATANLLVPVFLAIPFAGEPSLLPALAATLGCSLAFCLPVATPPNAIVYGSGHVPLPSMIRAGVVLDLGCAVLVWLGLLLIV